MTATAYQQYQGINKFIFEGNQMAYWAPLGFDRSNSITFVKDSNGKIIFKDTSVEAAEMRRTLRSLMVNDAWNCAYDHSLGPVKKRDRAHWRPFMKRWGVHKSTDVKRFIEPEDDFLAELETVVLKSKRS